MEDRTQWRRMVRRRRAGMTRRRRGTSRVRG
jgi:hypothetical protein